MSEPTPLPIACTLTGASLEERVAWLRRLGDVALIEGRRSGERLELRFRSEAADDVRELVRAESECCPFLSFELDEQADQVVVRVAGSRDAMPVLDGLLSALR